MSHSDAPAPGEQPADNPLEQSLSLPSPLDHHAQQQSPQQPPQALRALDDATLQRIQRDYPQLTELNLDNNELRYSSISCHLSLYLPSLRSLHLSFNHLARIPDMGALTQLTALDLKGNNISHIEHLSGCRRLEHLDLSQNQISDLPTLLTEFAGECPSLTSLDLQQNPLSPPQYRVALISLLGSLRTLDGLPIRAEEKAYLQLLAATHVDESSEGQQSEHRSAEAEQGEPSQWALTVPAGAAPVRAPSQPQVDNMHVQDVDELSDHASSPLLISAGPSSVVSTPRGGAQPIGRAESAALAHAAAEAQHQRQEQKRREEEEAGARPNMERIPPVELQPSASQMHAAAAAHQPFSPQDPATAPAENAQSHALPSRYSSNYSSIAVSRAESPAVHPVQQPHSAQHPPVLAVPAARSQHHAFHQPALHPWHQDGAPAFVAPQLHYHLPPHPPQQVFSAPPPQSSAPAAAHIALESALVSQTHLLHSLQQELQEVKGHLAREQAHVRTVKAYYQQPAEQKSASVSAAPSLPHSRRSSAAPPAAAAAAAVSLLTFPPPPAPISAPSSQALDSLRLELSHAKKQNELLQIQNETTHEILRIKDKQAEETRRAQAQAQQQASGRPGAAVVPEPDLSVLWRDKVFALLVQNKSLLLTHAADLRGYKQQLLDKTQTITQMEQQALLLGKSNAALQNQLQIAHNESAHHTQVQEHAHLMQTQALASSARTARDVQSIQHMLGVFAESVTSMEDAMRSRLDARLAQFNARLDFARRRVAVVQAIKGRKAAAASSANSSAMPAEQSQREDDDDDFAADDGDGNGQHLRREIQRLQADRSLIYSSWQREVTDLRSKLYASSSSLSSAGDALKSSELACDKLRSEVAFLRLQNTELLRDAAAKVPEARVREMQAEHARKLELLEAELAAVRSAMVELQTASEAAHRSHLKTQVELSQARHALSTAQTNAAELSAAKYDYLEEKLRRKDKTVEELAQDKTRLQERIKEMEQERILMRYGVMHTSAHGGSAEAADTATQHAHSHADAAAGAFAPPPSSNALAAPSRRAPVGGAASASAISNLLFGSASVPVLSSYQHTGAQQAAAQHQQPQLPLSRPPPIQQQQWQPSSSVGAASAPAPSSLPASTGSLLHSYPIPAVFGASAAALEQHLCASASAASTRASSRMQSVAPSPARSSAAARGPSAPVAPHIPPLHLSAAHLTAAVSAASPRPPQGVASPPLAAMAAKPHSATTAQHTQQQPRIHAGEVSRKLSHLAALSARLLDDDDD